jgi:hypothetical protein
MKLTENLIRSHPENTPKLNRNKDEFCISRLSGKGRSKEWTLVKIAVKYLMRT